MTGNIQYFPRHKFHRCKEFSCAICEGGLALCVVCGGAEGSLPTECPRERMTNAQENSVYAGTHGFVGGRWITKQQHEMVRP